MRKEKRYIFEVPLTKTQLKMIENNIIASIGIPSGQKIFATVGLLERAIIFAIVPVKAAVKLDAAVKKMRSSTHTVRIDQLSAEDAPRVKHQAVARKEV